MEVKERRKLTISDNLLFKNAKGEKIYLSGVNYWPRKTGPLMWSKWDPAEIRNELRQMKEMGMNINRSFLYIPDLMPTPDKVEEKILKRFLTFLDICLEEDISTIPTFFVGHMSGEEWDFPWRDGRSLYEDEYMLEKQSMLIQEVVNYANNHKAIIGWLFSNEMPNHGGNGPRESVTKWVARMTKAVRSTGDTKPISPGDGAWSPEIWGKATEWHLTDLLEYIDFIGPHIYPFENDNLRHSYNPAFAIKMATALGKPAMLEEFGASNTMASEENQGAYFRTTLNSVFINGGVGSLGWCYSDFDLEYQRPYSHRSFELQFGVTRIDGTVKPSGKEFISFNERVSKIDFSKTIIHEDPVSILIPSYYHHEYQYTPDDRKEMKNNYKQTMVGLKQAGINPNFLFEETIDWNVLDMKSRPKVPADSEIIFAPTIRRLTSPYWRSLINFVEKGGWLYVSYSSDGWVHLFEELFGAKHNLRFGLVDLPKEKVKITFVKDFGNISEGDTLEFLTENLTRDAAFCPVVTTTAEVIAVDDNNRPALLLNEIGEGKVIFSTYPLEHYSSTLIDGSARQPLYKFYSAICAAKGIRPPLMKDNKNVELGILLNNSGIIHAYAINHSWDEEEITIYSMKKIKSCIQMDFEGEVILEENSFRFSMGSKEVKLFEIGFEKEKVSIEKGKQSTIYMEE